MNNIEVVRFSNEAGITYRTNWIARACKAGQLTIPQNYSMLAVGNISKAFVHILQLRDLLNITPDNITMVDINPNVTSNNSQFLSDTDQARLILKSNPLLRRYKNQIDTLHSATFKKDQFKVDYGDGRTCHVNIVRSDLVDYEQKSPPFDMVDWSNVWRWKELVIQEIHPSLSCAKLHLISDFLLGPLVQNVIDREPVEIFRQHAQTLGQDDPLYDCRSIKKEAEIKSLFAFQTTNFELISQSSSTIKRQ